MDRWTIRKACWSFQNLAIEGTIIVGRCCTPRLIFVLLIFDTSEVNPVLVYEWKMAPLLISCLAFLRCVIINDNIFYWMWQSITTEYAYTMYTCYNIVFTSSACIVSVIPCAIAIAPCRTMTLWAVSTGLWTVASTGHWTIYKISLYIYIYIYIYKTLQLNTFEY